MIFALATPVAQSALAVFRLSGDGCLDVFKILLERPVLENRKVCLRNLVLDGVVIDRCSVVYYGGPNSFTGEDSVEVFCHGGLAVISSLTSAFLGLGFREAGPGEFSRLAYENNKLSLNEVEAAADLIHSEDVERARLSAAAVSGQLSKAVRSVGEEVDSLRVFVEGSIDFSDEDYNFLKEGGVEERLKEIKNKVVDLIDSCLVSTKKISKRRVLFFGPPNTGKSSLFNSLLGFDRALVSSAPGTTRDLIDSEMFYNSVSFELVDSAGVREAGGLVEQKGVALSNRELDEVDLVLVVLDRSTEGLLPVFSEVVQDKNHLFVFNKLDEGDGAKGFNCLVSAKTGEGVQGLKSLILKSIKLSPIKSKKTFLVRGRHLNLFESALRQLNECELKIKQEKNIDLAAEDLRVVRGCFDEFLGVKFPDDLLGDIFKDFCIGK